MGQGVAQLALLPLICLVALATLVGLALRRGRRDRRSDLLLALLGAAALAALAHAFELLLFGRSAAELWRALRYLGLGALPPLALALVVSARPVAADWRPGLVRWGWPLAASVLLGFVAAATDDLHGLFFGAETGRPLYWVFVALAVGETLVAATLALLLPRGKETRGTGLALAFLLPPVAGIATALGLTGPLDLAVVALAPSAGLLFVAALARDWLGVLPTVPRPDLLDALEDGLLVVDSSGRVVDANAAAHRLLGATGPPTLTGRYFEDLLPQAPPDALEVARPSSGQPSVERPWIATTLPGGQAVALRVHPLAAVAGRGRQLVVLRDATAQARIIETLVDERETLRRQQSAIKESNLRLLKRNAELTQSQSELAERNRELESRLQEAGRALERGREAPELEVLRLQMVLDQLPDALLVVETSADSEQRLALVNAAARRFWPAPLDLGHAIRPAGPLAAWSAGADTIAEALATVVRERRSTAEVRATVIGADGVERTLALSAAPLVRSGRPAAIAVLHDLTSLVVEADGRGEFVSIASHELRAPLTVIRGYVQSLLHDLTENGGTPISEQERNLKTIERQTSRMLALVNDLLDISRIETGRFTITSEPTLVVEYLGRVFRETQMATQSHQIEFEFASGLEYTVALWDQNRIEQVIANLVQNAVKYSPSGTTVEIRVVKERDVAVRVSVKDEGPGIPADARERVFERYYQASDARTTGLGLGLFISREIVQAHGGRMWVESADGHGSTFMFALPVSTDLDDD
jgi:signal transduction histidine kinase/PAS domain-containing protein